MQCFGDNLTGKRRSVENKSLCKLVYVKMNAHLVPNSYLPQVESKVASFVEHAEFEYDGDIISFAEHVDAERDMEMETARLLAGPGQQIAVNAVPDEVLDMSDEEEGS